MATKVLFLFTNLVVMGRYCGVCFIVNNSCCTDLDITSRTCKIDLECLMTKCRPFYLLREFSPVIMAAVFKQPQANALTTLNELYGISNIQEDAHPEATSVVAK